MPYRCPRAGSVLMHKTKAAPSKGHGRASPVLGFSPQISNVAQKGVKNEWSHAAALGLRAEETRGK